MDDYIIWVCESDGLLTINEELRSAFRRCADAEEHGLFCGEINVKAALERWPWVEQELETTRMWEELGL